MPFEGDVAFKAWFVAAWFAAFFLLERLRPAAPAPTTKCRLISNGVFGLLLFVISPLIVLPLTALANDHALWERAPVLTNWPGLLLDILLLDLWTYWIHRAYHEFAPMRRLHRSHHLDEHLDTTSAVRFHTAEVALSASLRMIPIVILAIPFRHVVIFETVLLTATLFHHSNVSLPPKLEKALSRIIVTPSIHWVHHHAVRQDTDSNYAGVFSLWDPLFGTRSRTKRTPEMKIGFEGVGERSLLGLLLDPFRSASR